MSQIHCVRKPSNINMTTDDPVIQEACRQSLRGNTGQMVDLMGKKYMCMAYLGDRNEFVLREIFIAHPAKPEVAEWSGEGLPTVGIDVEIHNKTCRGVVEGAESFIGTNCKVLATFVNVNGYEMVAVEDTAGACMCFRADMCGPVRTPEQIAAEERSREVDAAFNLVNETTQVPGEIVRQNILRRAVEAMINAGYRKQADK